MNNQALVVGGSNGIGLAIVDELLKTYCHVYIVDKVAPEIDSNKVTFYPVNLVDSDYAFLFNFKEIDTLIITAGFGRIAEFESLLPKEIYNCFQVNAVSLCTILNFFFEKMKKQEEFHCAVMGSISGLVSSPLFALYGATKSAVCSLIESLNIELEMAGTANRILNVSPGSIKGTKFNGGENNLNALAPLAQIIIKKMQNRQTLFIPDYDNIFKDVITRYHNNPHQFGIDSFHYKIEGGRLNRNPQLKIGYLSGTFDLFHIGHLNLLRRAKEFCDYLVVGVHKDASHKGKETFIPFDERCEIVKRIEYVDEVILSEREDVDVYKKNIVHYNFLFVGSDYKGSERFNRYEEFFADKDVKIIYFPYTKSTSSSQLRKALLK